MAIYIVSDYFGIGALPDTPEADKLIVTRTAVLYTSSLNLDFHGAWTVTIDGSVQKGGIHLLAGNTAESTITIGRTGSVQDDDTGISLASTATVKNYGLITAGRAGIELFGNDRHDITNAGRIAGHFYSIHADPTGSSVDHVTNLGTLNGQVVLGGGEDTFFNGGYIYGGGVSLDDGEDHLVNRGKIFGDVFLGKDNDIFTESGRGYVDANIYLGTGDDTLFGGVYSDSVYDGEGKDKVDLGGGNDFLHAFVGAGDDADMFFGGAGVDTYDVGSASIGIIINLDKVEHNDGLPTIPMPQTAAANTANFGVGLPTDTIFGFEKATSGSGADFIYGSAAGNVLDGGDGSDQLYGFGGNDSLVGGVGASGDTLVGGLGRDTLEGGGGLDHFVFNAVTESGKTATTCDVIKDFRQFDGDKIDLSGIDADTTTDGLDHTFHLLASLGQAFGKHPGELRALSLKNADNTPRGILVQGDVNGDGKADFAILLKGVTTIVSSDFVLM